MSLTTDDENLQQARERVMQLAREVEGLSRDNIAPEVFFAEFLQRVVSAVGAQAGAVWLLNGSSQISLAAGLRLDNVGLNEPQARQLNDRLLTEVLSTGEACTLSASDGGELQVPTDHLLILSALHKGKDCVGVVELFQRNDAPEEARPGYLQFVEQMCGYASRFIEGKGKRQTGEEATPGGFWQEFEPFILRMQQSLDSVEIAEIAASDGRLLLGCDRLSVATKKGRKVSVNAVSGQTTVNPRANLIRAMAALSRQVIAMGEPLMYSGRIDNLAPQVEKPLANYVQESTSRMVFLIPMFENLRVVKPEEEVERKQKGKRRQAMGCLIVEQVAESEPAPALERHAELVADHVGAALWNARSHERIFGRKIWRTVGRLIEWFHGRRLATAVAILGLIAAAIGALVFVPYEYRVEAQGKVMPVAQKAVFAPWNGKILPPEIDGGDRVRFGDLLLVLSNEEIEEKIKLVDSELREKRTRIRSLGGLIEEADAKREEDKAEQYRGEREQLRLEARYKAESLERLKADRAEKLEVRADMDGVIPEMKIQQLLSNRPVQPGEHLFDIMDDKGEWHLEVHLEEKRMGHLLEAVQKAAADIAEEQNIPIKQARKQVRLTAEFVLATDPEKKYECVLETIATRTSAHPELGTVVELFVKPVGLKLLEKNGEKFVALPDNRVLRIGADVRVKIDCGKRSLGYVLFGDVVEFFQRYLWL